MPIERLAWKLTYLSTTTFTHGDYELSMMQSYMLVDLSLGASKKQPTPQRPGTSLGPGFLIR